MSAIVPVLLVGLRLVLGGIFLWAGWAKISEPALFAQTVRAYEVLPLMLIHPYAIILPWIEVVAGGLMVLGIWTRSSALVILILLISFGFALSINLYRGADFSCGCFGFDGAEGSLTEAFIKDMNTKYWKESNSDMKFSYVDRLLKLTHEKTLIVDRVLGVKKLLKGEVVDEDIGHLHWN